MLHDFDNGPRAPIFTKTATVIKMAPAIRSQYSASPETFTHMLVEVDFDGDQRLMRLKVEADRFIAAPLLRPGEKFQIDAHTFKGDDVNPQALIPLWENLRRAPKREPEGEAPVVECRATIVHVVGVINSDHQHTETVVHFRVDLHLGGKVEAAYFSLKPSSDLDAPLVQVGYPVDLKFTDWSWDPGKINVKSFRVDWAAVLKAEAEAAGKK